MIYKLREKMKEPFWSAGQKFGWEGAGISISVKHFLSLKDEDFVELEVKVGNSNKTLRIQKLKARELYKKYKSDFTTKNGDRAITLPLNEFIYE